MAIHRLWSLARLKATDARNLSMPVKVTLRIKDKLTKSPDQFLRPMKTSNPGLHTEYWEMLDRLYKTKAAVRAP
jgi:hypothetical protein